MSGPQFTLCNFAEQSTTEVSDTGPTIQGVASGFSHSVMDRRAECLVLTGGPASPIPGPPLSPGWPGTPGAPRSPLQKEKKKKKNESFVYIREQKNPMPLNRVGVPFNLDYGLDYGLWIMLFLEHACQMFKIPVRMLLDGECNNHFKVLLKISFQTRNRKIPPFDPCN